MLAPAYLPSEKMSLPCDLLLSIMCSLALSLPFRKCQLQGAIKDDPQTYVDSNALAYTIEKSLGNTLSRDQKDNARLHATK